MLSSLRKAAEKLKKAMATSTTTSHVQQPTISVTAESSVKQTSAPASTHPGHDLTTTIYYYDEAAELAKKNAPKVEDDAGKEEPKV